MAGKWFHRFGPGLLVTAAFIGPGTLTTATVAGARFGFSLSWVLLFAVVATVILQEMAARLGLVTRAGLGEALRSTFANPYLRVAALTLVLSAIAVGNAAFEVGNITGAALGLASITGLSLRMGSLVVGVAALLLLVLGAYPMIERFLIVLVAMMGIVFLVTAVLVFPHAEPLPKDMWIPALPDHAGLTAIALIGTTVVPYNLFLHAGTVCEKWSAAMPLRQALRESRWDTVIAVAWGGVVTLAVLFTAASCFPVGTRIDRAAQMADQLVPLLGPAARPFFALGMLAAGLTSAITAPLAAAYACAGVLGWPRDFRSRRFRMVGASVIILGAALAIVGIKPVSAIVFAQAANGLLLPLVAVFLLVVMNRRNLLRGYANGLLANILGGAVVLIVGGLGVFQLANVAAALHK